VVGQIASKDARLVSAWVDSRLTSLPPKSSRGSVSSSHESSSVLPRRKEVSDDATTDQEERAKRPP